jgi:hypothetical protein
MQNVPLRYGTVINSDRSRAIKIKAYLMPVIYEHSDGVPDQ